MAVTPFKSPLPPPPPLFRKPRNDEISKRSGVRLVAVDCSNYFFLTLQDILNLDLSFIFGKNASNKNIPDLNVNTFMISFEGKLTLKAPAK